MQIHTDKRTKKILTHIFIRMQVSIFLCDY